MSIATPWTGVGLTHVGLVRPANQDTLLIDNTLGLWIVADGMGGRAGGDVASQLAVETIHQYLAGHISSTGQTKSVDYRTTIQSAIVQANAKILQRAKAEPKLKGMGTTVVLVFMPNLKGENAFIAHAGDSRAYLIRNQQISALTRDHTLLEERIQVGLLPKTTSSSHPLGHVLTRGVGVEPNVEPEVTKQILQPKDEILLCSDGLIKMLNDEQIHEVSVKHKHETSRNICQAFIDESNRLGGKDNTTVVLIRAEDI